MLLRMMLVSGWFDGQYMQSARIAGFQVDVPDLVELDDVPAAVLRGQDSHAGRVVDRVVGDQAVFDGIEADGISVLPDQAGVMDVIGADAVAMCRLARYRGAEVNVLRVPIDRNPTGSAFGHFVADDFVLAARCPPSPRPCRPGWRTGCANRQWLAAQ